LTLDLLPSAWAGIAVAGGCGLLIGLERERRKQELDAPEEAGIRSFAITALGGALAQTMDQPLLVAVGGLAVGAMLAVSILSMAYSASVSEPRASSSAGENSIVER